MSTYAVPNYHKIGTRTAHILGNLRFISDISVSAYSTSLICFQLRFGLHVKSDRNPL